MTHPDTDALHLAEANAATWVTMLRRHAHLIPEHRAVRTADESIGYAELDARIDRAAAALDAAGVRTGDRVAILMGNRATFVDVLGGAHRLGAIAVPVNFRLVAAEVAYLLGDCGARVVVTDQERAAVAAEAVRGLRRTGVLVDGPDAATAGPTARRWAPRDFAGAEVPLTAATVAAWEPNRPALLMYTSGTTGRPKGAVLTYLNLLVQTLTGVCTTGQTAGDAVVLCASPLFHIAGVGVLLPAMLLGHTVVLAGPAAFDPAALLDLVEAEGVTGMFLVPTQWQAMCDLAGVGDRALRLRTLSWGASPAPPATLRAMANTFPGIPSIAVFGQTEMSPVTCALHGDDAIGRFGSVGRPIATVDMRVVDDDLRDVAAGEVGEIVYRGPSTMSHYWGDEEATSQAMRGGWFHSGDLVRVDDDGFVYVVDRKKDMIISGGENIYSVEVEAVIQDHPKVREVAVIGVPHPTWVETPVAVVAAADPVDPPTTGEIVDWCRERLASYKKPSAVHVVDALPRNPTGKVLKTVLRERYAGLVTDGPAPHG